MRFGCPLMGSVRLREVSVNGGSTVFFYLNMNFRIFSFTYPFQYLNTQNALTTNWINDQNKGCLH